MIKGLRIIVEVFITLSKNNQLSSTQSTKPFNESNISSKAALIYPVILIGTMLIIKKK